jgi:hypothetical protein
MGEQKDKIVRETEIKERKSDLFLKKGWKDAFFFTNVLTTALVSSLRRWCHLEPVLSRSPSPSQEFRNPYSKP